MKTKLFFTFLLGTALLPAGLRAEETNKWNFDVSLYGLAAGMSGEVGLGPVNTDVNADFDEVWDHLKFGAMGTARVGYGRWALSTDVIYMELEGSEGPFTAEAKQWMVQPQIEYRIRRNFGVYAGARYYNIDLKLNGPLGVNPSDEHGWWDPVVGARIWLPFGEKFSFNVAGDVGGFGAGSDLSWQVFPYFDWRFTKRASLQLGYRLLSTDYETGSGISRFKYDILSQGPQLGFSLHF